MCWARCWLVLVKPKCPEINGTICYGLLDELNVWVNGVDVLQKFVAMSCLLDDKGVIHILKPQPRWMGGWVDGHDFKLFHEKVGHSWADERSHGFPMYLFIILTLEEEKGVLRQNSNSAMMCCIDMDVLRCIWVSCSHLYVMMEIAVSAGTYVKRGLPL